MVFALSLGKKPIQALKIGGSLVDSSGANKAMWATL